MAISTQAFISPFALVRSPSALVRVGFFALVYYLGVRVGLELVTGPGTVWVFSPANPIAIALVILSPPRIWPAYFLALFPGTLLAVLPTGEFPLPMALGLTASNAIQIFLAAWLMRRFVGTPVTFTRVKDVLGLVALAAGLSCAVRGLFAAAVFAASFPEVSYWSAWGACFIGNAAGIIFITPVLLVGANAGAISLKDVRIGQIVEAGALFAVILAASIVVFGHHLAPTTLPGFLGNIPPQALSYIMFPWLIWAALRFGPHGAAAASFAVGVIATWSTYHGYGPFVVHDGPAATDIFSLQLFLVTIVLTSLLLAAIMAERRRAEEVLRESEERLGAWMDNTRTAITLKDTEGRYLLANKQFQERFEVRGEEIVGKTAHDLFPPEYADRISAQDRQVLETGTADQRENETPLPDGATRTTILHKFPIIRPDGVCMGIGTIETDITGRKRAEERFRRYFDVPLVGSGIYAPDKRWIEVNDKLCDLSGYPREELMELTWVDMTHPDDVAENLRRFERALSGEGDDAYTMDKRYIRKNGEILHACVSVQCVRRPDGEPDYFIVLVQDLTERKRAEEALVREKRRNELILEAAGEGIYGLDDQGRTTFMNPAAARMIGWEPEDLIGRHPHNILHHTKPDGTPYPRNECPIYAAFTDGQVYHVTDDVFWRKDGTSFPVEYTSTPIRVEGELAGAVVVFRDITKRKRAEKALKESEERFRQIYENTPVMLNSIDKEGRLLSVSDYWLETLGYEREEVLGRKVYEFYSEKSRRYAKEKTIPEFIRTGFAKDIGYQVVKKNGEVMDVLLTSMAMRDEQGTFVRSLAVMIDITERKRAEAALRESEERFRAVVDNSPTKIHIKDLDGRYTLINRQSEILFGATNEEARGKTSRDIFPKEVADSFAGHDQAVIESGQTMENEEEWVCGDGVQTYLTVKFPILGATGEIVAVGAIGTDITERKRAEEALRESEQRFKDVAEAASDWFWEMDENLCFTSFSGRRQQLIGLSPKENIGKTRWEVADANPDDDEKWRHHRATLEAHEAFRDFEYAFTMKDGKTKYNKVSGRPVFDADGVFKGYRGAATDVTEQIEAQAQLIQASKLATLGEMASGIAHELNQPLSVVGMAAELSMMSMDSGAFDTEFVRKKLETIAGQRERMADIINHMRLFSRKDKTRLAPFDPAESVRGAVGLTAKQLEASGIELEATVPAACRNVSGHPLQLEQVVLNLLNNARDAVVDAMESAGSGKGRSVPRVRVSLVDDRRRKAVVISVADTGGGIPEQVLGRIFDPFFTTKKEAQGTGLGLSISYSIIDAMGGRLEAQNADGGAVFRITLPVLSDGHVAARRRPKARNRKPPTCKPRSHMPRVLFVEDEEAIVKEVAEYLRRKGYEVVTAGNAAEALELQASRPADMVITDLLMPGMGGDELIRRLRQTDPELPIVVMTGHTNFGDEQDIVAEGASAVLQKPISLRELSERLQRMVNR